MWPIWPSWRLARHPGDKSDGWAETRVSLDMILPVVRALRRKQFPWYGGQAAGESRLWLAGRLARDMPGTGEARTTYLMNGCRTVATRRAHDDGGGLRESQFREGLCRETHGFRFDTGGRVASPSVGRRVTRHVSRSEIRGPTRNIHRAGHVTRSKFMRFAHIDDDCLAGTVHHLPIVFHPDRCDDVLRGLNFLQDDRWEGLGEGAGWVGWDTGKAIRENTISRCIG